MSKFVFVTGGFVSSVGKGTTAAALARLLKNRGIKVGVLKINPYLNIDPGTMSPYQHGEVFITDDGAETDIDIGSFERFLDENLADTNDVSVGKIFTRVINNERQGKYVGATVQIMPHVTTEIKQEILAHGTENYDVVICVVGGSVNDFEQSVVLQAVRMLMTEIGEKNVFVAHTGMTPKLESTGELKVEILQSSIQKLTDIGVVPDALICRTVSGVEMNDEVKKRIARRCFMPNEKKIIHIPNLDTIYDLPIRLQSEGLDELILNKFNLSFPPADLNSWKFMAEGFKSDYTPAKFVIVGKYIKVPDAYASIHEAIKHACTYNQIKPEIVQVDAEDIEELGAEKFLRGAKAIIVPPGWGSRGFKGMIQAIKFARENKIPYLGIGFGMQLSVIEFGRNVLNYDANSTEIDPKTEYPVVDIMEEQKRIAMNGKTMRLGNYDVALDPNSVSAKLYGKEFVTERHRNRYEFNSKYYSEYEKNGMLLAGMNPETKLIESVELKDHPFFVATIYQPECKSRPNKPHPLFLGLANAAKSVRV